MVKWTHQQQLAIDSRDKNLLLSAAAGSGKTAVLVERIIQLIIQDHANIDSFLIVTFTNAAAGEMRERIGKALYATIEKGIGGQQHLRTQIQLLDRSFISTLHSFCLDIVKRYFHLIDIDPIFRIGDTTETSLLKLEALEELFETEYEKNHSTFLELVEMYGGSRNDVGLQNMVAGLYDFIQSKPHPEEWLLERVEDFSMDQEAFSNSLIIQVLMEQLLIDIEGAIKYFYEAQELATSPGGPDVYFEILQDDIQQIEDLKDCLNKGLIPFYKQLKNIKHKRLKSAKEVDEDLKQASQDRRNKGKEIIKDIGKKLLKKSPEKFVEELNEMNPHMQYLAQLAINLDQTYTQNKQEKGILDFNDLEHYALEILQHHQVVKEYKEKFDYIFVDEYQDSNSIQDTIVDSIKRENNVFLVGDIKQSIYRFRLADPTLFIEKYENYKEEESSINQRIDLNKNFRSRKEIIDGVNFIFSNLMSKEFGEIEYDDSASLYLGGQFKEIENSQVELNIIEVEEDAKQEKDILDAIQGLENVEIEAHWVAKRIKELLEKEIYDSKQEKYRKITYKDIVVLLRTTKGWADAYAEIFIEHGIPVYADINRGYFETIEINILMNLLKVIDNKRQDIPLLSVLRSPIFAWNTEQLIKIRASSLKDTYFEAMEEYMENNEDSLSIKVKNVFKSLRDWKKAARYIPIEDFIWKLLMESNYYYYVGAMPGGLQRQANIRLLLDRARQFQKSSMKGLFHFVKFVDQLKSSSGDMGTAKVLGENDNVVRIMSIHKSKGLEFPVVILGGMGKQFNLQDTRQAVLFHKDLGLGPNYVNLKQRSYNESIAKIAMKNKIKYENLSEEMRVLYVALTRAKDKLIMVGLEKNLEKKLENWCHAISPYNLANGKNYLDWVGPLVLRHEQGNHLRKRAGSDWEKDKLIEHPSQWQVNCIGSQEITYTEYKKQLHQKNIKDQLVNDPFTEQEVHPLEEESVDYSKIIDRLNWSYEHQIATQLPSKLSVTDIIKGKADPSVAIAVNIPMMTPRPSFMEGKGRLSGQEKGVATHFVLQHLDLDQVESIESIWEQIQWMIHKELIREEEGKAIDVNGLWKFFQSSIGKRMLQADYIYREVPFNLVKSAHQVLPNLENVQSCNENILVQGVIDCYFQEGEEFVLIDYKTDYYHSETMKQKLVQKYSAQVQLYKEALEKIQGKKVKAAYLYLLHGSEEVKL